LKHVTESGGALEGATRGLEPVLGLRDLVFFYGCAIFGIRLIPLAASIGPSVVAVWCLAMLVFYVPQALTVIDLSTR
jgi:hypothetical protein